MPPCAAGGASSRLTSTPPSCCSRSARSALPALALEPPTLVMDAGIAVTSGLDVRLSTATSLAWERWPAASAEIYAPQLWLVEVTSILPKGVTFGRLDADKVVWRCTSNCAGAGGHPGAGRRRVVPRGWVRQRPTTASTWLWPAACRRNSGPPPSAWPTPPGRPACAGRTGSASWKPRPAEARVPRSPPILANPKNRVLLPSHRRPRERRRLNP